MTSGDSEPLIMPLSCPQASNATNYLLTPTQYVIWTAMTDSTLDPPRSRGSCKLWAYPPHWAAHPGSRTFQAQHSHQGLLAAGQNQIWAFQHIPPTGGHGLPCSHSFVLRHETRSHPSLTPFEYLETNLDSTEWKAVGAQHFKLLLLVWWTNLLFGGQHQYPSTCWSSLETTAFHHLTRMSLMKERTQRSAKLTEMSSYLNPECFGQQLALSVHFYRLLGHA